MESAITEGGDCALLFDMSLVQQIRNWFATEGSFVAGTMLLMQTGARTERFQRYFSGSYVPEEIDKQLKALLVAYLDANADDFTVSDSQAVQIEAPGSELLQGEPKKLKINLQEVFDEPIEILKLRQDARKLHKQQAMLHGQLSAVESDTERLELAREIMEKVIPALDGIYDTIREFEKTGELPSFGKTDDGFRRGVDLMKKLGSLKPRISKLRGLLKKPLDDKERQKYEQELREKELEVARIEKEIM